MDRIYFKAFHGQLGRECEFATKALAGMNDALSSGHLLPPQRPSDKEIIDRFYYSTETFLLATTNISRCFWPSVGKDHPDRKRIERRCNLLRKLFEVKEDSTFKNRDLRDNLEHFDERIDKWYYCSVHRDVIDSNLLPIQDLKGFALTDTLRNFDPQTRTFYFAGAEFPLEPMVEAIMTLKLKLSEVTPDTFNQKVPTLYSEKNQEEDPQT